MTEHTHQVCSPASLALSSPNWQAYEVGYMCTSNYCIGPLVVERRRPRADIHHCCQLLTEPTHQGSNIPRGGAASPRPRLQVIGCPRRAQPMPLVPWDPNLLPGRMYFGRGEAETPRARRSMTYLAKQKKHLSVGVMGA